MYRRTMQTVTLFVMGLLLGGTATAFTLRLGPIPTSEASSPVPSASETDLPTPQFFRVAIGQDGAVFGVTPKPTKGLSAVPEVRFQERRALHPAQRQATQQTDPATAPRRLSGVELLLLQQTEMVAGSPGQ